MLIVEVHKIIGTCVVHKKGDKIYIKGPEIDLEKTDRICIHALQAILHYAVALENGVDPAKRSEASTLLARLGSVSDQ